MADGIISAESAPKCGLDDPLAWYADKVRTMRFLGIDAFCKDLLEFGHNQDWDSTRMAVMIGSTWARIPDAGAASSS